MRRRGVVASVAGIVTALGSVSSFAATPVRAAQLTGGVVQTQVDAFKNLYSWGGWQFTGVWSSGNSRFAGTATGSASGVWDDGQAVLYPFSIQSADGQGSLTGTCSGSVEDGVHTSTATGLLTCTVSVDGTAPATVQIKLLLTRNTGSTDTFGGRTTDYDGGFRAL